MAKKLVEVKVLRSGLCTPRISNGVEGKTYITTEEEAKGLSSGKSPFVEILGDFEPKAKPKAKPKAGSK